MQLFGLLACSFTVASALRVGAPAPLSQRRVALAPQCSIAVFGASGGTGSEAVLQVPAVPSECSAARGKPADAAPPTLFVCAGAGAWRGGHMPRAHAEQPQVAPHLGRLH